MSTRSKGMQFRAQGLGDRIHLISVAYQIAINENQMVTLNLAQNHISGKLESFKEIFNLFPSDKIFIKCHQQEFGSNSSWKKYLQNQVSNPKLIGYSDHPGWLQDFFDLDASKYILNRIKINPKCSHNLNLPHKFITVQWDSTGRSRRLEQFQIKLIEEKYKNLDFKIVTLGGEGKFINFRKCLACCSSAIAKSSYYVGVDSGFMHLALQIIEPEKIHIFTNRNKFWSHHLFRAKDMGVQINPGFGGIRKFDMIYVKIRYDSPKFIKFVHHIRERLGIEPAYDS